MDFPHRDARCCKPVSIRVGTAAVFDKFASFDLDRKEQLDAEAGLRSSFIQLLGGVVLVVGLYFTARGFRLTREGHITERYAKAIEQLGNPNADVRIGGIYGLERIARDSATDRETVIEVLTTFVREHTRSNHKTPADTKVEADVQAAITVVARRPNSGSEGHRLDFYHSGLNGADFRSGEFRRAMFYYSRLDGGLFSGANLEEAGLSFCRAQGADKHMRQSTDVEPSDRLLTRWRYPGRVRETFFRNSGGTTRWCLIRRK